MAENGSIDKRSSASMGAEPPKKKILGLELMEKATGLRGGDAKEKFQSLIEKVFSLMLNEKIGNIRIKKTKAGKITKIQAH